MARPMKTLELHYPMIQFLITPYSMEVSPRWGRYYWRRYSVDVSVVRSDLNELGNAKWRGNENSECRSSITKKRNPRLHWLLPELLLAMHIYLQVGKILRVSDGKGSRVIISLVK